MKNFQRAHNFEVSNVSRKPQYKEVYKFHIMLAFLRPIQIEETKNVFYMFYLFQFQVLSYNVRYKVNSHYQCNRNMI